MLPFMIKVGGEEYISALDCKCFKNLWKGKETKTKNKSKNAFPQLGEMRKWHPLGIFLTFEPYE